MSKRKFKKMLKKEKNPIIMDIRSLNIACAIITTVIILANLFFILKPNNNLEYYNFYNLIIMILLVWFGLGGLAIFVDLYTDVKISKMYKKYKEGEDYNNCCKRIKKIIIHIALILYIFAGLYMIDFVYCELTLNRPILSIKDKKETREYLEKYKAIGYNYYKCNDGRTYLTPFSSEFNDPYFVKIGEEEVLLEKNEVANNVYMGIPNLFKEVNLEHINDRYRLLGVQEGQCKVYQCKDGKINLLLRQTSDLVKDEEIEGVLDGIIDFMDEHMGEYIVWDEQIIQTVGETKKVGILSFYMDYPGIEDGKYYCYMWIYSVNGQYIVNSFDVDKEYMEEWKELGKIIENTIEFNL